MDAPMTSAPIWSAAASAIGSAVGVGAVAVAVHNPFDPLWGVIGSFAGGMTSLYFQPWKTWGWGQIIWWVLIATAFAFFVAPMIFSSIRDQKISGGIYYLMATGTSVLLPLAVRQLQKMMGGAETSKSPEEKP